MLKNNKEFYDLVSLINSELGGLPTFSENIDNQSTIDIIGDNNSFVELDRNFDEYGWDYYSHIRVCLDNNYYHCEFSINGINCYVHKLEDTDYYKKIIHSEDSTYYKFLSVLYQFLDIYGKSQN